MKDLMDNFIIFILLFLPLINAYQWYKIFRILENYKVEKGEDK